MSVTKLKVKMVCYILVTIGLACVLAANLFDYSVYKIDIDVTLANVGVLFCMMGGIQWLYDISVRQQLHEEITSLTVSNINIVNSGIADIILRSKDVDYSYSIRSSKRLIIGMNYSPRILEDYVEEFRERSGKGFDTTITVIDIKSEAGKLIFRNGGNSSHIESNIEKLNGIVGEINNAGKGKIKVLCHSTILRYSFVQTEDAIWIKPYRNSEGRHTIPATKIKDGTRLHQFYASDINSLIKQSATL